MAKEIITTGKSIEEATEKAYAQLGVSAADCMVEVLEKPKKSLFGKIKVEAKVKVTVKEIEAEPVPEVEPVQEEAPATKTTGENLKLAAALDYLRAILAKMNVVDVEINVEEKEDSAVLTLTGDDLGILIGRHGETLDSLQYLTSLVCNRVEGSYYRVTLDCGNYREKRKEALKELAQKISAKVKRTGRSQMLEPMNPYERRIIHAVISNVEGVTSKSKGDEPNRRVVIIPTNKSRGGYNKGGKSSYKKPRQPERTMEQILKSDFSDEEKNTKRYSKIEL